jgi:hypothetical protein
MGWALFDWVLGTLNLYVYTRFNNKFNLAVTIWCYGLAFWSVAQR